MRRFVQYQPSDSDQPHPSQTSNQKTNIKNTLQQCKDTIATLLRSNVQLESRLKQKESIIQKLIEQKQQHLLHAATCKTQTLMQQLQQAEQKEKHLKQCLKQMQSKYDEILQKHKKEIQRLSSYNRALKIDNAGLREFKEIYGQKKRRNGCISQSVRKQNEESVQLNKADQPNFEAKMERDLSVTIQTPNKIYTKPKAQPSTEHSLKAFHSMQLNSTNIPRNLFNNQLLKQITASQPCVPKYTTNIIVNNKIMSIERVIARVNELLADSQSEC